MLSYQGNLATKMDGEPEWAEWWREIVKALKWPPDYINQLTFAQLVAMGGTSDAKVHATSWEDPSLRQAISEYVEREKVENALAEAEMEVARYLSK